jgi:hypothetical protein
MRLYAPLYEGDGILRPDAAIDQPAEKVFKAADAGTDFVRSNIQVEAAKQTELDLHGIEQTARALRGAELARLWKAMFTAIDDWLERNENRDRDNFFAASSNLADLEQRERHWERTGLTHY